MQRRINLFQWPIFFFRITSCLDLIVVKFDYFTYKVSCGFRRNPSSTIPEIKRELWAEIRPFSNPLTESLTHFAREQERIKCYFRRNKELKKPKIISSNESELNFQWKFFRPKKMGNNCASSCLLASPYLIKSSAILKRFFAL